MTVRMFIFIFISTFPFSVQAVEVSKADWLNAMTSALPTAFCSPKQYFRQCFTVTAQECEETAASATRICLNKSKEQIPNILVQPKDGTHWGTVVGGCAGEAYELALVTKRIESEKCSNPANWQ
jgi:hypothetical protein